MCGIVGYVGKRECADMLLDGLRRLEYRGYDSAGVAIHDGQGIQRVRAEGKLRELERAYLLNPVNGTTGIAHTRWATHGAPVEKNAHPHQAGSIVLVHNGIIENYVELKHDLQAAGSVFASDTDTEIVAHLIARESERSVTLHEAVQKAIALVRGSYALVTFDERDPSTIVVARNASPMVLGLGDTEMFAASDVPAILQHTRDVIFLEDEDTAVLRAGTVQVFDASGAEVERASQRILWDPVSAEKQGYKHFMLKEIHEQPARVVDTLRGRIVMENHAVDLSEVTLDTGFLRSLDRVIILACGTSWHAGVTAKYALEGLARVPVEVDLASEFRYRDPIVTERTLAIAISQSGETADTLAAIREARRRGAQTLAVCNVMGATLARECGNVVYTQAGPEIGVASTKAFTTQLAALYLFAVWLGQERETIADEDRAALLDGLRAMPTAIEAAIGLEEQIRAFAADYIHARGFLFLGRGSLFPIALEGALKLKEISYIHAEGYAAGEMKHGPIALIDDDLPVVVMAPENALYEKTASNLEEVKARGGRLIVVTTEGNRKLDPFAEHVLEVPSVSPWFDAMIQVVPLQLLSYCIADAKGTDIDQPRNLAKSVTVE